MFQIGEMVAYGIHGVCRVVDQEQRMVDGIKRTYLALEPVAQGGSKYLVPTHNAVAMGKLRSVVSLEKAQALLRGEESTNTEWVQDENRRKQLYRELISSGDADRLLGMVRMLYTHKASQASSGRKLHMCDENFLRDAERLLVGEISVAMGLEADEVREQLRQHLRT